MTESESVALPLGDAPITNDIITDCRFFVKPFLKFFLNFLGFSFFIDLDRRYSLHFLFGICTLLEIFLNFRCIFCQGMV